MTSKRTVGLWANDRLRLVVTSACNINCFYCHNEGQPKGNDFFPRNLFDQVVGLIKSAPPKNVTLTGGEALLHPRLEHFVRSIKFHCRSVTLVTNGLLLDDSKLGVLVESGLSKVRLGVDSFTSAKSRPSSGSLPALNVQKLVTAIRSFGVELELNIVLTKFNMAEIPEMFRTCSQQHISAKVFEHVAVDRFGTINVPAEMCPQPAVEFPEFVKNLRKSGVPFRVVEVPEFRSANYLLSGDGFSWRYCRYLCPFGLCYKTGTRIDPNGTAYACMEKRFVETLSSDEPQKLNMEKLRRVAETGCDRDIPMNRSIYVIKPEAISSRDDIRKLIVSVGLNIVRTAEALIPGTTLEALYEGMSPDLRKATQLFMGHEICEIGEVEGKGAVQRLVKVCGHSTDPNECDRETIRGRFGLRQPARIGSAFYFRNAIHRPESEEEAQRDLQLFAPILRGAARSIR